MVKALKRVLKNDVRPERDHETLDRIKDNIAQANGWRVFRLTTGMIEDDPAWHLALIAGAMQIEREDEHGV